MTVARTQALLVAATLGTVFFCLRKWLEVDMARHMLIELPLLLLTGMAMGKTISDRADAWLMGSNRLGLSGLTFTSLALAYWMVPVVLDQSLSSTPAAVAKYSSFLIAGAALSASFRAAPLALQAFFVGNWVWMLATVGLLFQTPSPQFCVNYLLSSQWGTGEGLVAGAIAIGGLWAVYAVPVYLKTDRAQQETTTHCVQRQIVIVKDASTL